LAEEARGVAEEWVNRAIKRNIDLGFELEKAPALGDALLLRELLANLLDNALLYTPSGSQVTVRTLVRGGSAVLQVEDNGPGIPEEERSNVLERFYRLGEGADEGCGLGLAIVREIAQGHGAETVLGSPVSGQGLLVEIRFPPFRQFLGTTHPPQL
jgi:two-component system sensor histidine kinase TctE